jgi:integrase
MCNFSSRLWFNNRRIKKNGEATIYLQVIIDKKHREFSVFLDWPADLIDLSNGKLLPRYKQDPDVNDYNLLIEMERSKHTEINRNYRIRKEPLDMDKFARELNVFNDRESFTKYLETESKRRFQRREIDKKTYQNAEATRKTLVAYDGDCLFKNITIKWLKAYRTFLNNKPYKPATVWSRLSVTKAYLRLASIEPLLFVHPDVHNFPNPKPKEQTIFLDNDELRRLMILQYAGMLTDIQYKVLTAFIFTCLTSLRISDVYRVNDSWFTDDGHLRFIPHKNRKKRRELTVVVMPMAKDFLKGLHGKTFDLPAEQTYNRILKDLAKMAEINKKLSSHVGRHTYGYLYMTTIGNTRGLQEILGHSKLETTEKYAHLDDDYQKQAVKKIQDKFSDLLRRKLP